MPHILVQATDTELGIKSVFIHAEVVFSVDLHKSSKSINKLNELENELNAVLQKYFEPAAIDSEILTNHEYNKLGK